MPARHPPGPQSDPYIRAHVVTPCHFTSMSQCHPALLNVSVHSDPEDWPGGSLQHVQATVTMAAVSNSLINNWVSKTTQGGDPTTGRSVAW